MRARCSPSECVRPQPVHTSEMSVLVVGSVALDSVETPFGSVEDALGGSATFFSASASHFTPVRLVGVVGSDYPIDKLAALEHRGVDLSGIESAEGPSFHWRGRYGTDLNSAQTIETRLGVFANFRPKISDRFKDSEIVFLANIDPDLQLSVLQQVPNASFVACDTMNHWISSKRERLLEIFKKVDLVTLNDGEARQLTEQVNLVQAARWILARGPRHVVIKKGEHGAFLFSEGSIFFAPAYPLESVFDPTGAGDSFAGGFIGYLARAGRIDHQTMRRAMIYGSAMGSFAVEQFSIDRVLNVSDEEIAQRVREFQRLVAFEEEMPERVPPASAGARA
jgi:sugar/nucleoside kinase (ribokinase family)